MAVPNIALFHTFELIGFYLPPFLIWACAALVVFAGLRWVLNRIGFYRFVWHRSLFNLALYVLILGGAVFLGSFSWL